MIISGMDLYSNITKYIDHSILKPQLTYKDIEEECQLATKYKFASVCINPAFVKFAFERVKNSPVKVCSVVGFPLGLNKIEIKVKEALKAIEDGAKELDIVWNITAFKSKDYDYIERELKEITSQTEGVVRKVIIETGFLTDEEKILAVKILVDYGVEFVKTSTGFNTSGATINDINVLKEASQGKIKIKASGGIRDLETFMNMISSGAERIGTSSSLNIINEYLSKNL
ncbi:MAG: deoxyribose-phosphate aldolase [Hydrogenothermaceae bacterium]|nr:deoxyribose-phosphate aldolase [Hydrogenothermaceae bacterium]